MVMPSALSHSDKQRVEAAIVALEARTSAELAVVVARQSHDYAAYPFLWAAALSLLGGGVLALARPTTLPIDVVLFEGFVFVGAYLGLHFTPLGIAVVPKRIKQAHARRLAAAEFANHIATRTADRAGMLLYVSIAERDVEILVDRKIDDRVDRSRWQTIVERFRNGATGTPLVDRLVAAVEACADLLADALPPSPGQKNEIADQVKEL
jgi:putative membrane protein